MAPTGEHACLRGSQMRENESSDSWAVLRSEVCKIEPLLLKDERKWHRGETRTSRRSWRRPADGETSATFRPSSHLFSGCSVVLFIFLSFPNSPLEMFPYIFLRYVYRRTTADSVADQLIREHQSTTDLSTNAPSFRVRATPKYRCF